MLDIKLTNSWNKGDFTLRFKLAKQIASLINSNNSLNRYHRPEEIIHNNYFIMTINNTVIACVRLDRQSYNFTEIRHLCVTKPFRRVGFGRVVTQHALDTVVTPLIYASVRKENTASCKLFESLSFREKAHYVNKEGKEILFLIRRNKKFNTKVNSGRKEA